MSVWIKKVVSTSTIIFQETRLHSIVQQKVWEELRQYKFIKSSEREREMRLFKLNDYFKLLKKTLRKNVLNFSLQIIEDRVIYVSAVAGKETIQNECTGEFGCISLQNL